MWGQAGWGPEEPGSRDLRWEAGYELFHPGDGLTKLARRWWPFKTTENTGVTFQSHERRGQVSHAWGLVVVEHALTFTVSLGLPSPTVKLP